MIAIPIAARLLDSMVSGETLETVNNLMVSKTEKGIIRAGMETMNELETKYEGFALGIQMLSYLIDNETLGGNCNVVD